jgi:hypothetical protein
MVTSIVLTGRHTLNINSFNKLKAGDNIISIEKDIPFVRYRFGVYNDEDFQYIISTMDKLKYSTHLIEINLDTNTVTNLEWIKNNIANIARFIYIDVTDEDVTRGGLTTDTLNLLMGIVQYNVDRVMLKDKSTKLDIVTAKKIIDALSKQTGIKRDNFGICSSPLSFGDMCCLTAVRAREIMAVYSLIADVALPTANHQCMNRCGCIRYIVIDSDTDVISESKANLKKESKSKQSKSTKNNSSALHFRAFDL